jgi:hypothetical protein
MPLDIKATRQHLQNFDFPRLFIEELGWNHPPHALKPADAETKGGLRFRRAPVAVLSGIHVFTITTPDGTIPDAKGLAAIHAAVSVLAAENLLIFTDTALTQSLWYWVKREAGKSYVRDHLYVKGQPGDLFLGKLATLVVDISELDAKGSIPLTEVSRRLKDALDVERVTKKFFKDFDAQRLVFIELIQGIDDDHQRRWYASVLMNRLMFIYFLQKKFFLDGGNEEYLQDKLVESKKRGVDKFYAVFLNALFFEGFAMPEPARSEKTKALLGRIRYLNGGLFLPHRVELNHGFPSKPRIKIPDEAFENVLALFKRYSWNLNDTPGGKDDEINPDVLGFIFEKYINQKQFGAYYTRPEMTGYLCERTIYKLVLGRVHKALNRRFATIADLILNLDAALCRALLFDILPSLRLLDPACGSAAFLVAAMKVLIALYSAVIGKIQFLNDDSLTQWHTQTQAEHPSVLYFIKKQIITSNLFGVDIMEEATEIARLRLFLALVASAQTEDQLEPLPNIDFNILSGNSLIGLLHVDPAKFDSGATGSPSAGEQGRMKLRHSTDLGIEVETTTAPTQAETAAKFVAQRNAASFAAILEHKNKSIELYRKHAFQKHENDAVTQDVALIQLRSDIENVRRESYARLNPMLLSEFQALGIQFEQSTWDAAENTEGKTEKRRLKLEDIAALQPFHWGYEFDKVMADGGFDGIVTNPPWETFQPDAKEFFADYSDAVTKKKMGIKEFQAELKRLLRDPEIMEAWLAYHSHFNHQRNFFRFARQYENQVPVIDGKRQGKDVNLFKLFLEQCLHLLRVDGECGIVMPSGIYTDLGAKKLRETLFAQTQITGLFGFENRKEIFEGVDSRFKFVVLTFMKGGKTVEFPAAFMRHDIEELSRFPQERGLPIKVELVTKLSPDSLSVMEFKSDTDIKIAEKTLRFPLLGEAQQGKWQLELHREFNMTDDAPLFRQEPGDGRLPLYEGKMIWHFAHELAVPRYWISERAGRSAVLGRESDKGQKLGYQSYRLAYRSVASSTNERSMVATIIPPCFTGNSLNVSENLDVKTQLFCVAVLDSLAMDWFLRLKVTTNINMFYVYQLPVPRLTEAEAAFRPLVERAARLIGTTTEFDGLLAEIFGPKATHRTHGERDPAARARLRAELDALVAQLYGLTEPEFAHILTTFPLVEEGVKQAALNTYRDLNRLGKLPATRP